MLSYPKTPVVKNPAAFLDEQDCESGDLSHIAA
jgi:hypothetical protein